MATTVTRLTQLHETYRPVHAQMEFLRSQFTERFEPELMRLFDRDGEVFDIVIQRRLLRDATKDRRERNRLRASALEALRTATEVPIEIAMTCTQVAERALTVFDIGYKAARGDSGVAVSTALSGGSGALFVAYLNLTKFREGEWAVATRSRCDALTARVQDLQRELFDRVARLQEEGLRTLQLPLL
jgi:formiminotetrahydrofolate cyclodeaminase